MEQYPIPQFIEAEGKIAFFITFKQFFYLVAAGVICIIFYWALPFALFVVASGLVLVGAVVLAFVTINGVPLIEMLISAIGFNSRGKDYTWKKKESPYPFKPIQRTQIKKIEQAPVLKASTSSLRKIKTSIDLKTK